MTAELWTSVVLTQSCDLVGDGKVRWILMAPMYTITEFFKKSPVHASSKGRNALKQGNLPRFHLLNECNLEVAAPFQVVDFTSVFSLPFEFVRAIANSEGKRIRLRPPYREHLAQAFARFYMRVGLPVDLPMPPAPTKS